MDSCWLIFQKFTEVYAVIISCRKNNSTNCSLRNPIILSLKKGLLNRFVVTTKHPTLWLNSFRGILYFCFQTQHPSAITVISSLHCHGANPVFSHYEVHMSCTTTLHSTVNAVYPTSTPHNKTSLMHTNKQNVIKTDYLNLMRFTYEGVVGSGLRFDVTKD